ncbi:hypothetical protein EES43_27110 [Streptomyces sp. ADI96-02]|uniref:DMT family transporter n=1 Tax=Streptomyces sp. ADI96-02 TaxID=1522760 RepID=UPI000F557A8C|nr:DMT family transporter [Streptomyces sp. ADI96-02]RPK55000.1 hypothetical protein EES43_27110 [Streptomyces sp. ADI96-02]
MSSLALSVLLSLVSAVAYAAGAIVQERVAVHSGSSASDLLRNGRWWVAVLLNGVGALLHVVALAYGPLSLVQPLGALTIVFALPMAALFVGRKAGAMAWRGALMATAGLVGLLALTGNAEPHVLRGPEQVVLAAVAFGAVAAIALLGKALRGPALRSLALATAAGVAFGMASVFTKTVAMEWTSGSVPAGLPTLLVIAGLAAAGLLLSQAAYRGAGLTAPLATVTVVNPVVAAAIGISLFDERFRYGTTGALFALLCGLLAAAGLVLLTKERLSAERAAGTGPGTGAEGAASSAAAVSEGRAGRGHGRTGGDDRATGASPDTAVADPVPAAPVPHPEPATGRSPVPHAPPLSVPLPPGRAAPLMEFTAPHAPAGRGRRSEPVLAPRAERTVQTLTPPARR